jgi:alcohol dehydrogenase
LPLVLGNDLAGVVIKAGANVHRFKPGDEVYAKPDKDRIGTFAELIAISENDVAKKPHALDMEQAASIPLVGLTAWQALVEKAKLQPGQKVLIHAGSGGLGTIAIQLAKHLGATVATTTSTANVEWVKRLGADVVIDYRSNDSKLSFRTTTWSLTPRAVRLSKSPSECSNPAAKSSRWPGRLSPISPRSSGPTGS